LEFERIIILNVFSPQDADYSIHKLVLGTHTSDQEPNFLMIAKVRLPNNESLADTTEYSVNTKGTKNEINSA
jgi:histone-binding protein RBBP4